MEIITRRLALMIAALFATSLHAQQQAISADRPGFADGPGIVGARTAQIEVGVGVEEDDTSSINLPALVRIGVTGALELRIESDVLGWSHGHADLAPVSVGFKARLMNAPMPISLLASVQPPSGEGSLRSNDVESEIRLVGDVDLGHDFSITPNVGIRLIESDTPAGVVALTLERELENVSPFIDVQVSVQHGRTSAVVDGGAAWIVGTETQWDLSGGLRINGDEYPEWFVSAGISRRF